MSGASPETPTGRSRSPADLDRTCTPNVRYVPSGDGTLFRLTRRSEMEDWSFERARYYGGATPERSVWLSRNCPGLPTLTADWTVHLAPLAECWHRQLRWYYMVNTRWVLHKEVDSANLENMFRSGDKHFELNLEDGTELKIDFETMTQYNEAKLEMHRLMRVRGVPRDPTWHYYGRRPGEQVTMLPPAPGYEGWIESQLGHGSSMWT